MKAILFGGSFDPLHNGHITLVQRLRTAYPDHEIQVLVSTNWLKPQGLFSVAERLAFCRQVFADDDQIKILDWALTSDTSSIYAVANRLKQHYEEIIIALGEDNLASFDRWIKAAELVQTFKFILLPRSGYQLLAQKLPPLASALVQSAVIIEGASLPISSTELKTNPEQYQDQLPAAIYASLLKKLGRK